MKTRKELKEEYKQRKYKMGVFQIKNKVNGKIFVSSNIDLQAIWHSQKLQLDVGIHSNYELQKDWNEYGADSFVYEILDEIKQKDDKPQNNAKDLKALEEMIINDLQPFDNKGYNRRPKEK
jgi:hypothetical protein